MPARFLSDFQSLVADDARIDVAAAALAFAREEYPEVRPADYIAKLDWLAEGARLHVHPHEGALAVVKRISWFLFAETGFRGNVDAYDDPRNSFLNEVLERRTGLPITLSLVWTEVARRLRVPLYGVGLPGHFIAKYDDGETEILVDPFDMGKVITRADVQARLDQTYDGSLTLSEDHLAVTPARVVLGRMLRNLKESYTSSRKQDRALWVSDYFLALFPDNAFERRDRGVFRFHAGDWEGAEDDLSRALDAWPTHTAGRAEVHEMLEQVRKMRRRMN